MADFLLELFSEEIPARMQPAAAAQLKERFEALLKDAGLEADSIETYATPRRLALIARGLPAASAATEEERRGPRADAPGQAIEGFLKSTGLARDQLEERDTGKGIFLFAVIAKDGQPTAAILAEQLPALIAGFQWPKSQRWGAASVSTASPRWVRPLRGIVALLDGDVVPFEALGIQSGRTSFGHRFMGGRDAIAIDSASTYEQQLKASFVVLSADERRIIIRDGAAKAAAAAGLSVRPDEGLEAENAGLTEWPVPLLGHFDPAYLDVPPEIIQLTMRTNQKYFAVEDADGKLAPAFVCVANLEAPDRGATIIGGNERVLSARLSDARFFWEQDRKVALETHAQKLGSIVFHEKLGTMAEKVVRVARLARWLVETHPAQFPGATAETVDRAARLAKADLTTGTVGEFPELQGIIGSYLAAAQGEQPGVVSALKQHYAPVPECCIPVAVALADRLDTLLVFFFEDLKPTGSKDPFALRRAGISVIEMLLLGGIRLPLGPAMFSHLAFHLGRRASAGSIDAEGRIIQAIQQAGLHPADVLDVAPSRLMTRSLSDDSEFARLFAAPAEKTVVALFQFLADRLKVQQREAGVRHDLIDAVFALGGEDDLVRLLARVKALQVLVEMDDGANLLAGYKRAANILRIEEKKDGAAHAPEVDAAKLSDPAEIALDSALSGVAQTVKAAVVTEDFAAAMAALATLRPQVDRFFDAVTVNADDPALRANRLSLLAKLRQTAHLVADFSKIEG